MRPVLLVRPDGNAVDADALATAGVPTLVEPYLSVSPIDDPGPARTLLTALGNAGTTDWLIVTSPRTMPTWAHLVGADQLACALTKARSRGLSVAAVGTATAATLTSPPQFIGRSGAAELVAMLTTLPAGTALLPQSRIAHPLLAADLAAAGWTIRTAAVYDTVAVAQRPASATALASGNLSGVLLRSPSAVAALAKWAEIPPATRVFAVGPHTQAAAHQHSWNVVDIPVGASSQVAAALARTLDAQPRVRHASEHVPSEQIVNGQVTPHASEHVNSPLPADHPMVTGLTAHSPVIAAFTGQHPTRRPVWFMRQAGRSLPEYRALRAGKAMLASCLDPELAAELTLQPVRRHDVDAAIFFSDIMIPAYLAGVGINIEPGVGPVVDHPLRTAPNIRALPELDPAALSPIRDAVALAVQQLGATPLIGFTGAPFTVASYLVEGRPSRELPITQALMHTNPQAWKLLLSWVVRTTTTFLRAQAQAGASALQLFDSWAGRLPASGYRKFCLAHSRSVLAGVADLGLPRIHFGVGTRDLLIDMRDAGADVMGIDASTPLDEANRLLGGRTPLQGNIDPHLLSMPWNTLAAHTEDVVRRGRTAPGHVVNLGHGVPSDTDPDVLTKLVAFVHEFPSEED